MIPKHEVLTAILSHMNEGVIFLDSNHVIQFCNPAAERIRKVKADRIVGQSIFDIHPRSAHPQLSEMLISMKSGALPTNHRIVNAQNRYFDNSYSSIKDEEGNFLGTLLVSRDITDQHRLAEEVNQLKDVLASKENGPPLIFKSPLMQKVLSMLESVAPLDSTVLVTGESGTGKECVVDLIHRLSNRSRKPLIKVNCSALPESLIESELFGHIKGAFTGAHADNKGKFVSADGGTLFLDEIGDLPLAAQAKLLRVIQDKIIQPVGSQKEFEVDVRIVAATNCDLAEAVAEGRFREDLFYRLNVIAIDVPPLRERREDIIENAETTAAALGPGARIAARAPITRQRTATETRHGACHRPQQGEPGPYRRSAGGNGQSRADGGPHLPRPGKPEGGLGALREGIHPPGPLLQRRKKNPHRPSPGNFKEKSLGKNPALRPGRTGYQTGTFLLICNLKVTPAGVTVSSHPRKGSLLVRFPLYF